MLEELTAAMGCYSRMGADRSSLLSLPHVCFALYRAGDFKVPVTWASARRARFSPGYNIAGLQPSESAYDLSHLDKVFDKEFPTKARRG